MKNKCLIFALALALVLTLGACSGGSDASAGGSTAAPPVSGGDSTPASAAADSNSGGGNLLDWAKSGTYYYETRSTSVYDEAQYGNLDLGHTTYHNIVAKDGDDYASFSEEIDENGTATKRIQSFKRGDEMYIINHDEKMYMLVPEEMKAMAADLNDKFSEATDKIGEGTGEIDGKTLPYEEYDMAGVSIKYFLDNGQVYGYVSETAGITSTTIIINQSTKIPSELFEIPAGYTEQKA